MSEVFLISNKIAILLQYLFDQNVSYHYPNNVSKGFSAQASLEENQEGRSNKFRLHPIAQTMWNDTYSS